MSEEQGERFISEMDEYIKADGTSGIKKRPSGTGIQKINPQNFFSFVWNMILYQNKLLFF